MDDKRFLGTGMKFPPQVDAGTGRFALSSGEQSVKESVYLILMTNRGERWLEPGFGGQLMSYTFMDTSVTMLSIMARDIQALLLEQEPRISQVDVRIDSESQPGCLIVNLDYTVTATNTRDNLVFPFYLSADREEADQIAQG
ncbi:GPW/gp25 family protein [Pseudoflavonifractor phocaeensis]|uniref:GPW/gp25 family protein n=1 Tax=Pseudoflavonifractor phocaeensis TaxID=1870988 RepID=UPI00195DEEB1|nr:GPW/gp25 family protein [Pseudoflavonifractor phocaeensis]MBM6924812.1 GPW/gp25 family protein [Pseudoflavonifractor phocaeensis]